MAIDYKLVVGDVVESPGLFTPMTKDPVSLIVSEVQEDGVVHFDAYYLGVHIGEAVMDWSFAEQKQIWRWV